MDIESFTTVQYRCSNGHTWEATTTRWGHEVVMDNPCHRCLVARSPQTGLENIPLPEVAA